MNTEDVQRIAKTAFIDPATGKMSDEILPVAEFLDVTKTTVLVNGEPVELYDFGLFEMRNDIRVLQGLLPTVRAPRSFVVDNNNKTARWTNTGNKLDTDAEIKVGDAEYIDCTSNPMPVGDINAAKGTVYIRYKAVEGVTDASGSISNDTAYTSVFQGTPEASAYRTRITNNNGTISTADFNAVDLFVYEAKQNGYWNKLIDVGIFAGDNRNAALVKLKYPSNGGFLLTDAYGGANLANIVYNRSTGITLLSDMAIDTGTNLSSLTLNNGRYGKSMWLTGINSSALLGRPNYTTPWSSFMVTPGHIASYVHDNVIEINIAGNIRSMYHMEAFVTHKIFMNGALISENTNAYNPAVRNESLAVYQNSGNGYGEFYAIDDGSLTDAQILHFYEDVNTLLVSIRS